MKSEVNLRFTPGLLVLVLSLVLLVVGAYLGFQPSSTAHPEGKESLWIILLIIGSFLGVIGLRTRRDEIRDSQDNSDQIRSSEDQKAIHGFFSFALGIMAITVLVAIVNCILSIFAILSPEIDPIIVLVEILLSISLAALGVYALTRTFKKKSDGVYLLCAFLVVIVLTNLISQTYYNATERGTIATIVSIIWAIIFITYFLTSKQVKEIFPPKERTFTFIDMILSVSCVVLALISAFLD